MTIEEVRAKFAIGDKKNLNGNLTATLVGIEHDDLSDGSGKAKMTFIYKMGVGSYMAYGANKLWNESAPKLWYENNESTMFADFTAEDIGQLPNVAKRVNKA